MRSVEISPATLYASDAVFTGTPRAIIRSRSLIFAYKMTTVPDDTSAGFVGVQMSMDGVTWVLTHKSGVFTESQSVPVVITTKASLLVPLLSQFDSGSPIPNGNEYDIGMRWVRSWVELLVFAGTPGFTVSHHQIV